MKKGRQKEIFLMHSQPEMVDIAHAKADNRCGDDMNHAWCHEGMVEKIFTDDGCP